MTTHQAIPETVNPFRDMVRGVARFQDEIDLTPIFHPVATRDRRVLSPSSATVATGRDAASLSPAAYAAGVA